MIYTHQKHINYRPLKTTMHQNNALHKKPSDILKIDEGGYFYLSPPQTW